MASTDVRYVLEVDDQGAIRKLQTFDQALDQLQRTSGSAGRVVKSFGSDFLRTLVPAFTAGQLAADAVRRTFSFVKQELTETIQAAIEAEKVDRALESSLLITGQAAQGAAEHFKDYASELQRKTVYDDESIKSGQALLIQLGVTTDKLEEATRGAVGLASVFGMDLQSAARAVALGFEGNYIQLSRMIPAVRNATTDGEKHTAMVNFLAGAYQRAEDEAETFGGQLSGFKNTYNDLQETIGEFITKNESVIDTLTGVRYIIEWLSANSGKLAAIKRLDPTNYFGPISYWKSLASVIRFVGEAAREDLEQSENTFSDYVDNLEMLAKFHEDAAARTEGLTLHIDKYRTKIKAAAIDTGELVEVDVGEWVRDQAREFGDLPEVLRSAVDGIRDVQAAAGDFRFVTPAGELVWYKEWKEKQRAWYEWSKAEAELAEESAEETYGRFENFSNEFFQDITGGFARAFESFRLTTEGFKNFFIETWQAIKHAFFSILADMLARWLTMAFVRTMLSIVTGGAGGSFFGPGTAGSIGMQHGFEGTVVGPKLFYVEPGVREHVSATPTPSGSPAPAPGRTVNINFAVSSPDAAGVETWLRHDALPILKEMFAHGDL